MSSTTPESALSVYQQLFYVACQHHQSDPQTPTVALASEEPIQHANSAPWDSIRTDCDPIEHYEVTVFAPTVYEVKSNSLHLYDHTADGDEISVEIPLSAYSLLRAVPAGEIPASNPSPQKNVACLSPDTLEFLINRAEQEYESCREANFHEEAPVFMADFDAHLSRAEAELERVKERADLDDDRIELEPAVTDTPDFRWAPDPSTLTVTGFNDEGDFYHDHYVHTHSELVDPLPPEEKE